MLLRFLQKGLTFHNIPLMPGITAQDDENVVYSKQIGRKKTMARPGTVCCAPSPPSPPSPSNEWPRALPEVPPPGTSVQVRPRVPVGSRSDRQPPPWRLPVGTSKCQQTCPLQPGLALSPHLSHFKRGEQGFRQLARALRLAGLSLKQVPGPRPPFGACRASMWLGASGRRPSPSQPATVTSGLSGSQAQSAHELFGLAHGEP